MTAVLIPLWKNRNGTRRPLEWIVAGFTIVDAADAAWLSSWRWLINGNYVVRHEAGAVRVMHREILGLRKGDPFEGDHINGVTFDNRRENLRRATREENRLNVHPRRISSFRGVVWDKPRNTWKAYGRVIGSLGPGVDLGYFDDERAAAAVAAAWRKENVALGVWATGERLAA